MNNYDFVAKECNNKTYQITGEELIEMLEAVQDGGYILHSLESKDMIMSVILKRNDGTKEMIYNFLR